MQRASRICRVLVWATVTACAGSTEPARPVPTSVVAFAGDHQSATVGTPLPTAVAFRVFDQRHAPLAGISIAFQVIDGGGTVSPPVTATDADGIARTTWTLGKFAGDNVVAAHVQGIDSVALVHAVGVAGGVRAIVTLSSPDSAPVATAVTTLPVVRIVDAWANPVAGVAVTFAALPGSGTLGGTQAVTDSAGRAAVGSWTLGPHAGPQRMVATISGTNTTPDTIVVNATAGALAMLQALTPDVGGRPGSPLSTKLVVLATDAYGNPVARAPMTWNSAEDTVAGDLRTDTQGRATANVKLAAVIGPRTVTASAPGASPVNITVRGLAVTQLALGGGHVCELLSDASLWCWGRDVDFLMSQGALPFVWCGYSRCAPSAVAVAPDLRFAAIAAGLDYNCAITQGDGRVLCWGDNGEGQLGNGFDGNRDTVFRTPTPILASGRFVAVTAHNFSSCAITDAHQAYCWGDNAVAELGVGYAAAGSLPGGDVPTPTRVVMASVTQIVTGFGGCGLSTSGTVACWGPAPNVPDTTYAAWLRPTAIGTTATFTMIVAASQNFCGVSTTSVIYCFPDRSQLGPSGTVYDTPPYTIASGAFQSVALGANHVCALTTDGVAECWGANDHGQLGNGTTTLATSPTPVASPLRFTSIMADANVTCALATTGMVYCWGQGGNGVTGGTTTADQLTPTLVP